MARILRNCRRGLLTLILSASVYPASVWAQIPWTNDYPAAANASQSTGAVMMLHFYSDDCVPCKMLDARAFQDPQLISAVKQTVIPVKVNVDRFPQLAKQYSVTRWPTDVYIAGDGTELARSISPQKTADYMALLERVAMRNRDHFIVKQGQTVAQNQPAPHREQALPSTPSQSSVFQPQMSLPAPSMAAKATAATASNVFDTNYPSPPPTPTSVSTLGASMFAPANAPNPVFATNSSAQAFAALPPQVTPQAVPSQPIPSQVISQSPATTTNVFASVPNQNASNPATSLGGSVVVNQFLQTANSNAVGLNETMPTLSVPNVPTTSPSMAQSPVQMPSTNMTMVSNPRPYQEVANSSNSVAPPQTKPMATPENNELVKAKIASEVQRALMTDAGPAMAGYCPVTLDENGEWTQGLKQHAVRHRGRVYYLASKDCQKRFLETPDRYAPVLSGYDLVQFLHTGTLKEGLREYGCWYKGRVYMFCSEANRAYFDANVINLASKAEAIQAGAIRNDTQQPDPSEGRIADGMQQSTLSR